MNICNISKKDRITRIVFGLLFLLGALLGAGKMFLITVSAIMIIEGFIGWCGFAAVLDKLKIR